MSHLIVYGGLCLLIFVGLGAIGVFFVVQLERRREALLGQRVPARVAHSSGDITLYLRFEGQGAAQMGALVEAHGPYGILEPAAVRHVAEATLAALGDATHGLVLIAAYKAEPVRRAPEGGLVVCFRIASRRALSAPARPLERVELTQLLRDLASLEPAEVGSADLLRAPETSDPASPALTTLLGPNGA